MKQSRPIPVGESLLPNDNTLKRFDFRLVALFLAGFSAFIDMYAPMAFLPALRHVFNASESAVNTTISVTTLAVAISAPFIGLFADRYGRKNIITGAILLLTVPTALAALSQNLGQLVVWRFFQGLCLPGIVATTMAYISEEWENNAAGQAMAWYVAGTILGGFCGRFVGGVVENFGGWRMAFLVLAIINAGGGFVVAKTLPRALHFTAQKDLRAGLKSMAGHLKNTKLLSVFLIASTMLFCLVGGFTLVTHHLGGKPYQLSSAALGSVFVVYLVGVVVTPFGGKWIDKLGSRRMLTIGLAASSCGALVTLLPSLWAIMAGLAVFSSGLFVCQAAASNRVGQVATGARSTAAGLYVTFYYFGGSVGVTLAGLCWDIGRWPGVVSLIVGVQVLAATLANLLWRDRPVHSISESC